ncbi:MAG TPA: DNA topoisomerase 3 [Gaiellaceae bacterium]|nr:DNA topoisomerase 3 [Gaiellaceae bacterium]
MPKTLVVAEKPSVGRDIAAALPGKFDKGDGWLESDDMVVTWTVGHLVELVDPEHYDPRFKRWRMDDLPIVPDRFKLDARDGKAEKQLKAIHKLMRRDDVDVIVNACDAGREGELIFAYTFETAKVQKPVKRLWLNSMTKKAIQDAFGRLRDASELETLREAARSRSEADWLVGMNATRAATIRLRRAFDGAVSLGRVQTPTLAMLVKRELEIQAFVPEPYWLVEARFAATGERLYAGRYLGGKRLQKEEEAARIVSECTGRPGRITKLEKSEERELPQLLYDLTSLQRHANTLYGFPARRTLAAAQKLYEDKKLITYPRTNSRFLSSDLIEDIKPTVALVGANREYATASDYVLNLERLPLGRVVNDAKVTDHHAIVPTRSEQKLDKLSDDERKVYDLVARRFLAIFHPEAVFERTRVETTVAEHVFRTSGRVLVEAGWKAVYGEEAQGERADDDTGGDQLLPRLEDGEEVETREVESLSKMTQPPRRFTDASLLSAMETAGKDIEDAELRDAMKDSGIGTPATRAAIIERLINVGYVERDGRALVATPKGVQVISLLGEHELTSPELTGGWEHRLAQIEAGEHSREAFMKDIVSFTEQTVAQLDKLKDVQVERANLGPCPVCGRDVIENRKGYSCWSKDDPGCGFVIWKQKAGKTLPPSVVKELMANRRTEKPVTGFRGRSGRSFSAKLRLEQNEEGKWRVEFDEEWAAQPREEAGAPA